MRKRSSRDVDLADLAGGSQMSAALARGFEVLRAFRPGDGALGNQDVAARTGLPKATVSRLMFTLSALGYLTYLEALGRYTLGPAAISLGYTALSASAVVTVARPLMQALADETGAAVAIGTRDEMEMLYLANCRSDSLVTLRLNPGSRLPIGRSSMGLAYLVGLDAPERDRLLARLFAAAPADEPAIRRNLEAAEAEYAARGFCSSLGTWHSYIHAVGVPFRPRDGSPVVAITCGGISELIRPEAIVAEIGPALRDLVASLERRLEGRAEGHA